VLRLALILFIILTALDGLTGCTPVALGGQSITGASPTSQAIIPITGNSPIAATTVAPTILPSPTNTPPSPTVTATSTPSPSPTPIQTQTPSPIPSPTIPATVQITGLKSWRQLLSLDCESAAAAQWASFFGHTVNELEFQHALPVSDNPDYGFVGNVNGPWGLIPPYGYGTYASPVAALLNRYGVQAHAYRGFTLQELESTLSKGIPVIAWVIGNVQPGKPISYTDSEGRKTVVAAYEHVVIITGYTATTINYTTEGINYSRSIQAFLASWGVLGNMVVIR
jgi:uncharacterized protein YvpB